MVLRLMTSNIWGDYFGNPVTERALQLAGIYRKYTPDILGIQEATPSWWASTLIGDLAENYGQAGEDNGKNNFVPLFYRKETLDMVESGRYLYHEELEPTKGWTYGVFKVKQNGAQFAVFNTHFWWKSNGLEDDVLRYYNAKDLVWKMNEVGLRCKCPVFFMGDLNCGCQSMAWKYLNEQGWASAYLKTEDFSDFSTNHHDPILGEDDHYHGKTTAEPTDNSLDHIGIPESVRVLKHCAIVDQDALDATDHSPVFVDVTL